MFEKQLENKCWPNVGQHVTIDGLEGTWLVEKTSWCGGGCGHGPHDRYPDGYQITFIRIEHSSPVPETRFSKYRSDTGCFNSSATIDPKRIKVIDDAQDLREVVQSQREEIKRLRAEIERCGGRA